MQLQVPDLTLVSLSSDVPVLLSWVSWVFPGASVCQVPNGSLKLVTAAAEADPSITSGFPSQEARSPLRSSPRHFDRREGEDPSPAS